MCYYDDGVDSMEQKSKRVGIIMPEHLVDEIDKQARSLNLSRSSYITMVVTQHLEQRTVMATLQSLAKDLDSKEQLKKIIANADEL